jgi:hypothetical protein
MFSPNGERDVVDTLVDKWWQFVWTGKSGLQVDHIVEVNEMVSIKHYQRRTFVKEYLTVPWHTKQPQWWNDFRGH